MRKIGPHSRPGKLAVIDGRRAEAHRMKDIRAELTAHVGGNPTITQKMLIERIAMLVLRMELMDAQALNASEMTDRDARSYLGWNNAVSRMLRQLGLNGPVTRPNAPALADYLASQSKANEP